MHFTYPLAEDQSEPEPKPPRGFPIKQWLERFPRPTTSAATHSYEERMADPAWHWVEIPNVYAFYSSLDSLRRRFPLFQFEKVEGRGGIVTHGAKYAGRVGVRIRCRRNSHVPQPAAS